MIAATLYSKFPTISYNNSIATNITVRLKFRQLVEDNLMVFYPYTVSEGERADTIAARYYGDSSYSWLIYLANDIMDPLHDWHLTAEQFERYITTKYGSIRHAQRQIMFFRVDWVSDESMITISAYNALPSNLKKYWTPVLNNAYDITHYERTRVDWVIDTNRIVELTVHKNEAAPTISTGMLIYQLLDSGGVEIASGEVVSVSESSTDYFVIVKHVVGQFESDLTSKTIYVEDTAVGRCSSQTQIVSAFEPADSERNPPIWSTEENYWSPVTAYDYEMEINEAKKNIRLIDLAHMDTIERDLRTILSS